MVLPAGLSAELCRNCIDQGLHGVFFTPIEHVESGEEVNTQKS